MNPYPVEHRSAVLRVALTRPDRYYRPGDHYHRRPMLPGIFTMLVDDDGNVYWHKAYANNEAGKAFLAAGKGARFNVEFDLGFYAKSATATDRGVRLINNVRVTSDVLS